MGLVVHSLAMLPKHSDRDHYVYLLDYGWQGSLGEVLFKNFDKIAAYATENHFVVMKGTPGSHFEDEVFSWHGINGEDGENVLPAILITTLNPHYFQDSKWKSKYRDEGLKQNILLIPIKKICKTESDVAELIEKTIKNLIEKKSLEDFSVVKELKAGKGKAIVDCLILQPTFFGFGGDLKNIPKIFKRKK